MKPTGATLVFYAAATFLLGAIAYAVLVPLEVAERLGPSVNVGPIGVMRIAALVIAIAGPILFVALAVTDHD